MDSKLTTIPNPPPFQVIDRKNSVMLANITATSDLVGILDDKVLDQLFAQCRNARAEAQKTGGNSTATLKLCATLEGVLKSYRNMRDEHLHRLEIELERDEAEQRLQDALDALKQSPSSR